MNRNFSSNSNYNFTGPTPVTPAPAHMSIDQVLAQPDTSPIRATDMLMIDPSLRGNLSQEPNNSSEDEMDDFYGDENARQENQSPDSQSQSRQIDSTQLTKYAQSEVKQRRLTSESAQDLYKFASSSMAAQLIKIYSLLLEMNEDQSATVANWEPTGDAVILIRYTAIKILISPSISSYKLATLKTVMSHLKAIETNMFPNKWPDNPVYESAISKVAKDELTNFRRIMKDLIQDSIPPKDNPSEKGWTIKELADHITSHGKVESNVLHWARYSLLRQLYQDGNDHQYWNRVDAKLKVIRKEAEDASKETKETIAQCIHKTMTKLLKNDQKNFGYPLIEPVQLLDNIEGDINEAGAGFGVLPIVSGSASAGVRNQKRRRRF